MTNIDGDNKEYSDEHPAFVRCLHCLFPPSLTGIAAWVGLTVILQEYLVPAWRPPERAAFSTVIIVPIIVAWAYLRFKRFAYNAGIRRNMLETITVMSIVAALNVFSIHFSHEINGLSFFDDHDFKKVGMLPPVCLADGIVLGMSTSLLALNCFAWTLSDRILRWKSVLEEYAGIFAWYTILVGIPVLIFRMPNIPLAQSVLYVFLFVVNIRYAWRYFTKP